MNETPVVPVSRGGVSLRSGLNQAGMAKTRFVLRFVVSVTMTLYIIFLVPIYILAGLLLAHAETCQGRLFAMAVILGCPAPVMFWIASYLRRKRGILTVALASGMTAVLLLGIDYYLTPEGLPMKGAEVRSCFTGTTAYQRSSMANLVPEMDQLVLASYVIPTMDRLMDERNTMELRAQILAVYGEMRCSPKFECLGSVLNQTYQDLFLRHAAVGHFYEYIPDAPASRRLPVVIFLHGSLGNFRGYLWVWKRLADEYGFAIVAPTFGAGNWDESGGGDAIEQVRRYCSLHPQMDASRIYLAGLSNGGRGVCIGARRAPNAYRGLIFISPVLEPEELLTAPFVSAWKDKPILLLHGTADNRIPVDYIKEAEQSIRRLGIPLESQFYEGQTHFLFFTIRDQVCGRIGNWLRNN